MSFNSLLIHTVTVYNPSETGDVDRYGNEVEELAAGFTSRARVDTLTTGGAARELLVGRDTRQTWYLVFLPPQTNVTGLSVLSWEGKRLHAEGEPAHVYNSSREHHVEMVCREVEG